MTTILPITLTMAGAAALINLWLAFRVGQIRMQAKVSVGDGGNEALLRRMRAHSNFNEYTPIFLILMALIELASDGAAPTWLWLVGAIFVIGRICHGLGMDRASERNPLRAFGIMSAMILTLGLAIYAVYLPHGAAGTVTEAGAAPSDASIANAEVVPAE